MTARQLTCTLFLAAGFLVQAADPAKIDGAWSPDGGRETKIIIGPCQGKRNVYCGVLAWIRMPRNDDHNVNPALRNRPLVPIEIMKDFKFEAGNSWVGGTIYNVNNGRIFKSKIVLLNKNEIEVYEGEAKKPVIWRRVVL